MTKTTGLAAGRDQFETSRGRGDKPSDDALVRRPVGRGELLHRAQHGDAEARALLKRHGHGDEFELEGGDAA